MFWKLKPLQRWQGFWNFYWRGFNLWIKILLRKRIKDFFGIWFKMQKWFIFTWLHSLPHYIVSRYQILSLWGLFLKLFLERLEFLLELIACMLRLWGEVHVVDWNWVVYLYRASFLGWPGLAYWLRAHGLSVVKGLLQAGSLNLEVWSVFWFW